MPCRARLAVLVTCLFALACEDPALPDAGPLPDAGSAVDAGAENDAGAPPGCVGHDGLGGAPAPWAIPDWLTAQEVFDRSGRGEWTVLDVDGDGWIDLLTGDPAQLSWRLHRGSASGFDPTGVAWTVPVSFPVDAVVDLSGRAEWIVLQVDDDGVLDALVADPANLGWRLHRGGPSGFDVAGRPWAVPDSFPVANVVDLSGRAEWALMHADGDGWLDVMVADPSNLSWRLHRGGADGFDPTGVPWAIPNSFPVANVVDLSGSATFTVSDVDGDGVIDALAADPGQLSWRLHRGGADGFEATGAPWAIPTALPVANVADLSGRGEWLMTHADGDGVLDVLIADPGQLAWRLHRGGADGFDTAGAPFAIPASFPIAEVIDRSGRAEWVVRDVDGDGLLDALLPDPPNLGWTWIAGSCAP